MSDYEDMTVAQLKELLKEAGLPVSGKKADLIARLQEGAEDSAPAEEESAEEESVEEDDFEVSTHSTAPNLTKQDLNV